MAIFASTTTSGYSDPMKAMTIKALEQRQKDMMAQQATQQASMFTPENTQTPIQGLAQVANVAADTFRQNRAEQAAAEGRNEFASVIAQGPKGPGGAWAPEQLAVMARRAPEQMAKFYNDQHDLKYQGNAITSAEKMNTETQAATTGRSTADNVSREKISTGLNASNEAQTLMTTNTNRDINASSEAGKNTRLASEQAQQARMAQINADIDDAKQQKQFFQQDKQTDKANEQQARITKLQADLALIAQTQGEGAKAAMQKEELGQNAEMKKLDRELQTANLKLEVANRSQIAADKLAAEKEINDINNRQNILRDKLKAEQALTAQTQAEAAEAKNVWTKTSTEMTIAEKKAAAAAATQASDPERLKSQITFGNGYKNLSQAEDRLNRALQLVHEGVNTGYWSDAKTKAAQIAEGRWGTDKDAADRTAEFNRIVGADAIKQMGEALKGQTTNFEMEKFITIVNDPNATPAQRMAALKAAIAGARADKHLHANAYAASGGKTDDIDADVSKGRAGPPRPKGMDTDAIVNEARGILNDPATAPADKAAVKARLKSWNLEGHL